MIAFAAEALTGRGPREFILIPIVAYGGYYAAYAYQGYEISQRAAELRRGNLGKVFAFDAAQHSLVTAEAETLVKTHEIPVAYAENVNFKPERHLAYRLIPRERCGRGVDSQGRVIWSGVHFADKFQNQLCELRTPEAPANKIVRAVRKGDDEIWKRKKGIMEQTTDIVVDGAVVGSYRSASVWRLPKLPFMIIGCGFTPGKWDCDVDFQRDFITLDTVPANIDRAAYDTPISVMLGLRKFNAASIANFKGYPESARGLARAAEEPARVENDVFATLQRILDGQDFEPPHGMGYSIAINPDRLAPLAARMAQRFLELTDGRRSPNRELQANALATGLAALPRAAFSGIAAQIFDAIQRPKVAERYGLLYARAADTGPQTFPFYKAALMASRDKPTLRPAIPLAICRIGSADGESIAELKRRFVEEKSDYLGIKTALLVTLVKLGEDALVRENITGMSPHLQDWAKMVLSGEATTEIGPNNCIGEKWGFADYLGPAMAPALEWRGGWKKRAGA